MSNVKKLGLATTNWFNGTANVVAVDLNVEGVHYEHGKIVPREILSVRIPPQETVAVDSYFDDAIQTVKGGIIVSGLAPQLINRGNGSGSPPPPPPVHPQLVSAPIPSRASLSERIAARLAGVS